MTSTMVSIKARSVRTFDVSGDGTRIRIHVEDESGSPAALELPSRCLGELMMTLPMMLRLALEREHGDPSLRLVHELGSYRVEQMAGTDKLIVTLQTPDGFEVAFAFSNEGLAELAAIAGDAGRDTSVSSVLM